MKTPPDVDPIVVVGMACRFPGARGPARFAEQLRAGRTARPVLVVPGHDLVVELGREAFADAGIHPDRYRGSRTAVFVRGRAEQVSHLLGLYGPSESVGSALLAVHLAAESMRRGECVAALAGGAEPDAASGGLVLLKFRSAALADGDPVYCVLAGSATSPHEAYESAGIAGDEVGYVELHGGAAPSAPVPVGSAGSATAGLIKVVLGVSNRELVPSAVPVPGPNLRVQDETGEWAGFPVAAVSAADCHLVLCGHPAVEPAAPPTHLLADVTPHALRPHRHAVFVFSDNTPQWRDLLDGSPVFAARMAECAEALRPHTDWDLFEVLAGSAEGIDVDQAVLFAVQVALAEVWSAAGVLPDAVVGDGGGEVAAAVVAGALSLEDGARVAAIRSQALAMLAADEGAALPPPHPDEARGCLLAMLGSLAPTSASTSFVSSVTGQVLDGAELDAAYWHRNLVRAERFELAVSSLLDDGHTVFVELGDANLSEIVVGSAVVLSDPPADVAADTVADATVRSLVLRGLARLSPAGRRRALLRMVREEAASVLGHRDADDVLPMMPLARLGFDSMLALELAGRVAAHCELNLSAELVLECATPQALADHLVAVLDFADGAEERDAVSDDSGQDAADDRIAIVALAHRSRIADERGFDAVLFGFDAVGVDDAQRALLELTWEAFELAGIDPTSLRESRSGVFGGGSRQIARAFGLGGPVIDVDGPLVAVHMAAKALRDDECDLAVAGGAGEADSATTLVLERFSDARRNGRRVLAVIEGSAVGSTPHRAVAQALRAAGLRPSDVDDLGELPRLASGFHGWAGISTSGGAETSAHLILEAVGAPERVGAVRDLPDTPLLVSAADSGGLRDQVRRLLAHLEANPGLSLTDVAYSLATTRAALPLRVSVVGDRHEALVGLTAIAAGELDVRGTGSPEPCFYFTGEAPPAFGRELHAGFPVFAEAFDEVCAEIDSLLDHPLRDVVFAEEPPDGLDRTAYAQAGTFAAEVALYRLAEHWGLTPTRLGGRGVGEVSAAHCAGVLSLADACALVAARARLLRAFPLGGAMICVSGTEHHVRDQLPEDVTVVGVRGPRSVIVSGAEDAVLRVQEWFAGRGVPAKRLHVDRAEHGGLLAPMLLRFGQVLDLLELAEPVVPLVMGQGISTPDYWLRHAREAVRAVGAAPRLSLGSLAVLTTMPERGVGISPGTALVALLHPDETETRSVVTALAQLHDRGVELDWAEFFSGTGARPVELPTYPFQRAATPVRPTGEFWRSGPDPEFGAVLPALSSWWDNHNRQSECPVTGTWLLVTAAGADSPLGGALRDALAQRGVTVRSVEAGQWNREQFAEHLRAALDGAAPDGVLALGGVETDMLVLAMSDARIDARLWRLAPALRGRPVAARRGPRAAVCNRGGL
ncbi:acyltransferase domain-containing protein [Allokutzneria oryzae]|uniref:Acyltransferase domain-containing protein n=1 Tax=Allokutzneria oryzae TaxID=1378989 RepID=A0ABV5ZZA9_9PSEU